MVLDNVETIAPRGWNNQSGNALNSPKLPNGGAETQTKIARMVGYMRECLNQTLEVPKLARMANISPSHFFAVFKRQTGFAPLDFFIRLRMQRGCELLDSTSLSIKETAAALGYDDPFYFSRLFKAVSGLAPTDYRRATEAQRNLSRERIWAGGQALLPTASFSSIRASTTTYTPAITQP